ncbi:MAG: type II secretion system F family protein, partial [Phenylobacterium sp.]|nr:type II secretion system F family protein [Phenylobacterium sp.]
MNLLSAMTDPDNLLTLFVALVCFATIVSIATPMITRSTLETRLKSVSTRREELRRKSREALAVKSNGGGTLRHTDEGLYKKVVDRLQLSRL